MIQRIQKFLAHQGFGSRRSIEKMIADKRIMVNGQLVTEQGTKIDPEKDKVSIDGQEIKIEAELVYFWFNKPAGVVSSRVSQGGEPTVIDYIETTQRIYPVGRLDKESRGLLLLTNDGLLTHRLTHPKFHIDKTYEVIVEGVVSEKKLKRLREGVNLEEGRTAPAEVELIGENKLRFVLHEGKYRQIRRMCHVVNLAVVDLVRTAFGPILLADLPEAEYQEAEAEQIEILYRMVGLPAAAGSTAA